MRFSTSFDFDGDLIVVNAEIVGPSGRVASRLVLDTGAVLTTLSPAIAETIGYDVATSLRPAVTRTAASLERPAERRIIVEQLS